MYGLVCSVLPIVALGAASAVCYLRTRRAVFGALSAVRAWTPRDRRGR